MSEVLAEVLPIVWCTCSYYELGFDNQIGIVRGKPCSIHPNGCQHGCLWVKPCQACFDDSMDPSPEGEAMRKVADKIEDLSSAAYHEFNHVRKFEHGLTKLREIAALANAALAAHDAAPR
jgi:hypothetical protein